MTNEKKNNLKRLVNYLNRMERNAGDYEEPAPICPECGSECEYIYKDKDGFIVGCDNCIARVNADEEELCFY